MKCALLLPLLTNLVKVWIGLALFDISLLARRVKVSNNPFGVSKERLKFCKVHLCFLNFSKRKDHTKMINLLL